MMKSRPSLIAFLLLASLGVHPSVQAASPLPRSTPEAQGISSTALLEFLATADQQIDGLHSFMLLRHGKVVAEGWWTPYNPASNHILYSLSKSFTSTAVGLAIAEGKLSLDDTILSFFPEDAPAEPSNNLKAMRVRDLLCMSTGHQDEPSAAANLISPTSFLAHPVPHKPGTHFRYNTAATFMLSAIVQKQTGQTLLDYLKPRLFDPLGIEHPTWDTNFQGISLGGYGLSVRTEDIARFGQLYLQKGQWQGRPLLPADWVEAASARQTSNGSNPHSDWDQGYGYQFWRCRHGAYRGDGAFGQYCLVLPAEDAVIAITSGVRDMQSVLDVIWDKLRPAFHPQPLPDDPAAQRKLQDKLASLAVRLPAGQPSSPLAARILGRRYDFPANETKLESLTLEAEANADRVTVILKSEGLETRLSCGIGQWQKGRATFANFADAPLAASLAWPAEDTCVVKVCLYETPFHRTLTLRFAGDQVYFDAENNVGFGPTSQPQLIGRAQ